MSKNRKGIDEYVIDPSLDSQARRIAHFLNWAAIHMPKDFHQYNVVLKAIAGYTKTPRLDTKEVASVRGAMSRVRKILLTDFRRGMVVMTSIGVRATVDDADMLIYDVSKKGQRVKTAVKAFTDSVNIVDQANIPKTLEMAPHLKYLKEQKTISGILSDDFLKRLIPPKTETKPS